MHFETNYAYGNIHYVEIPVLGAKTSNIYWQNLFYLGKWTINLHLRIVPKVIVVPKLFLCLLPSCQNRSFQSIITIDNLAILWPL